MGHNIIGFSSNYEGRISSFFGEELIVGSFIHGFSLFFFSYVLINNKKNYLIFLFLVLSIILISFIIGERANFIKLLFSIIILIFFGFKSSFSKKIIPIILVFLLVITFTSLNKDYKIRYYSQVKEIIAKKGLETYLKNSIYGAHQNAALMIFKDYPIFGIGVKNFRIVSGDIKYENPDYLKTEARQSNHPHQIHMEFLSETGMFGYISFIIFILYSCWLGIKNYFKSKNLYLLSSIIYILSLMLPIIPSGSFLSSYSSGVFWINYAIMASYIVNKRKGLF